MVVVNMLVVKKEIHLEAHWIPFLIQMMEGGQVKSTIPTTTKGVKSTLGLEPLLSLISSDATHNNSYQ
jgi:hypothetical protein